MSQLEQEKQVNLMPSARLNAFSQYVLRFSFSVGHYTRPVRAFWQPAVVLNMQCVNEYITSTQRRHPTFLHDLVNYFENGYSVRKSEQYLIVWLDFINKLN